MFINPILPPIKVCLPEIEPIGTPKLLDPEEPEKPATSPGSCEPFLASQPTRDYLTYVAPPTTARITPFINGRNSNGTGPDIIEIKAFDEMQAAVAKTQSGDIVYLAAWTFRPDILLTAGPVGGAKTWGELFQTKAMQGVRVRILMTEFDSRLSFHKENHGYLDDLNKLIDKIPLPLRGNLQYQMSKQPVTFAKGIAGSHHQKFMIVRLSGEAVGFCGGLDISFLRTPPWWRYDGTVAWHDLHMKVEGLAVRDLMSEFVQRWNREAGNNPAVPPRKDWGGLERLMRISCPIDATPDRNIHKVQMHRTISVDRPGGLFPPEITKRDDIWQAYNKIIDCADNFLYLENQYFREVELANPIIARAARVKNLVVIIIVPAKLDEGSDTITEKGNALQHEFFRRLHQSLKPDQLRVYTMFGRFIHSKLIMADDRTMSLGSANANRRSFKLDTEANLTLIDDKLIGEFRRRLWEHNLSIPAATIANWKPSEFISKWDAVANANQKLVAGKTGPALVTALQNAAGECVVPFDFRTIPGKENILLPQDLAHFDNWAAGTLENLLA